MRAQDFASDAFLVVALWAANLHALRCLPQPGMHYAGLRG